MPVAEVGKICRTGIFFYCDAAQTAGVFPIHMKEMNINGLAFTGHKGLLGPQGIGGLLLDERLAEAISPVIDGGTGSRSDSMVMPEFLPDKLEPGTLNLPGILGLSAALDYVKEKGVDAIRAEELKLAKLFMSALEGRVDVRVVGPPAEEERCPIVSLDFLNMDNAEVAFLLDEGWDHDPMRPALCSVGPPDSENFPNMRFAFGHKNTVEEVECAIDAIEQILRD